jgi:adenosylcobinamide-phosphate synthase
VSWVRWTGRNFDAGEKHHSWVVWCVSVLVPALLAGGVYLLIAHFSLLLAMAFDVALLYLTLGFRQFSHYFTDIRDALDRGDENEARRLLAEWRHLDASELPRTEVLRHVIEHALAGRAPACVWRVLLVCRALGAGPGAHGCGALPHGRIQQPLLGYRQRAMDAPTNEGAAGAVAPAVRLIDHVPARLTAFGFAVVGNFEEAAASWRRDAGLWQHANEGVILAAAAGAVGVQLGGAAAPGVTPDRSKTFTAGSADGTAQAQGSTAGAPAQPGHLHSVVGLVWRSVVLWMLLVALLSLANVLGSAESPPQRPAHQRLADSSSNSAS